MSLSGCNVIESVDQVSRSEFCSLDYTGFVRILMSSRLWNVFIGVGLFDEGTGFEEMA